MTNIRHLTLAALLPAAWLSAQNPMSPRSGDSTYDLAAEFSYAGSSNISEGTLRLGKMSTTNARGSAVMAITIDAQNQFLIGAGGQWYNFDAPAASLVPDQLGSLALKVGWNRAIDRQWSLRFEADPGNYGSGSFGAPIAFRAIYAASRDLQWAIGVNYDWRSGHPLAGGVGVRWKFAPDWTLAFLVPAPRVEWAVNKELSLVAGFNLRGGTFKVANDFGRTRGRPAFDSQTVDYREISAVIGARWLLSQGTTLNVGVGYMTDRRFQFDDRNLLLNGDGAPSLQLSITSAF